MLCFLSDHKELGHRVNQRIGVSSSVPGSDEGTSVRVSSAEHPLRPLPRVHKVVLILPPLDAFLMRPPRKEQAGCFLVGNPSAASFSY